MHWRPAFRRQCLKNSLLFEHLACSRNPASTVHFSMFILHTVVSFLRKNFFAGEWETGLKGEKKISTTQARFNFNFSFSQKTPSEEYYKYCNVEEALDNRDNIARDIYWNLFKWLVRRINEKCKPDYEEKKVVLVDMHGFEV